VSKQAAQQRQVARGVGLTSVTFERFTDRARAVVASSEDCAREFRHNFIGTEHLLLAQYSMPNAIAAQVLTECGLEAQAVRAAIRDRMGEGADDPDGDLPFTPRSIAVFTGALAAALELGHNYIGTEHLLFGLVRTDGVGHEILVGAGLDEAVLAPKIMEKLAGFQKAPPPSKRPTAKRPASKARKARKRT
jgi:ATP-dependent Clp protease ATP-binding subunit ClpC